MKAPPAFPRLWLRWITSAKRLPGVPAQRPQLVLLSDYSVGEARAALPALLALSTAWKAMVYADLCNVPLIVETGQAIETHHVALLIAAGASAVFPYLALELSEALEPGGAARYRIAVEAGLRKVLARMGISTVASYRNSQLFEIVGLDPEVYEEFFEDAPAVLGGKKLAEDYSKIAWSATYVHISPGHRRSRI